MTAEQIRGLADTLTLKEFSAIAAGVMEKHFGPAQYGAVTWATSDRMPQAVLPLVAVSRSSDDAPRRERVQGSPSPSESSESPAQVVRASH